MTSRHVLTVLLSLALLATIATEALSLVTMGSSTYDLQNIALIVFFSILLAAHLRGWKWVAHVTTVLVTLAILSDPSLHAPEQTGFGPVMVLVPPIIAAVLLPWYWSAGSFVSCVIGVALITSGRGELFRPVLLVTIMIEGVGIVLASYITQTAQRNAEQQARRAEEARVAAEHANLLKSQFLANMSHELRTPLNSIINFTRILIAGVRGPVNEEQIDYLNRVRQSGEHLLGLINDILDLSKIEAGRLELHREPLLPAELVQSVVETAVGLIKGKPIELRKDVAPGLPPIVADRTRVRQILLNLISNAAKFTESGTITVQVSRTDTEMIFSVTDTGIGIAPEDHQAVFEEFRQVDGNSDRHYEGTGLGLSICRRLIQLHGGRIWLESTLGAGSTFWFSLPYVMAESAEPAVMTYTSPAETSVATVLVIDDDPSAIEIIATYLERDRYRVYGVSDSRRVVSEALRIQPAAIILDVLMPHKDGWEVLRELKADPLLRSIPILLYTIVEEQKLGFYLGASAYLVKPVDEVQLRETVNRLVSNDATIMVIDDDPNALEIVTQQLQQAGGYTVVTADGGQVGLDRIATTPPDLIILDLMMPEVDGFAVLDRLDRDPQTRTIPVVVLTAKDLTEQDRDYLSKRVNGLLMKGLTTHQQLLDKVSSLLESITARDGDRYPVVEGT
jgi:signal transduction histidine kinase/DNA-binding response OmpR family regulator